jgi:small subunit ribosomal protein S1
VTKVVTFGAFVEILPGVEGLVHISELAQHHVENPREVVAQGQAVNVLILEIDAERRRLSLSLKRVEEGSLPRPKPGDEAALPNLDLSEDVFTEARASVIEEEAVEAAEAGAEVDLAAEPIPMDEVDLAVESPPADEPVPADEDVVAAAATPAEVEEHEPAELEAVEAAEPEAAEFEAAVPEAAESEEDRT